MTAEWPLVAAAFFAAEACALGWVVVTRRIVLSLTMELGLSLISLGLVLASISLWQGTGASGWERAARLLLIGSGVLVLLVAVVRERKKPCPAQSDVAGD